MLEAFLPSLPMLIITVCTLVGGLWVFRKSYTKQLGELQKSVNDTYKSLSEVQDKQIKMLKEKVTKLEATLSTLQITLKKRRGLLIEINEDLITLIDQRTGAEHAVQIHVTDQHEAILKEDDNK